MDQVNDCSLNRDAMAMRRRELYHWPFSCNTHNLPLLCRNRRRNGCPERCRLHWRMHCELHAAASLLTEPIATAAGLMKVYDLLSRWFPKILSGL